MTIAITKIGFMIV